MRRLSVSEYLKMPEDYSIQDVKVYKLMGNFYWLNY